MAALPDSWAQSGGLHGSPTLSRMMLGQALRSLRESVGISREAACHAIRAAESKLSRLEQGRASVRLRDVADLCALYGVTDHLQRATLLGMAQQGNVPEWWHSYREVIPAWFEPYLGLEQAASVIRDYAIQFVPGLLQAPAYARALIRNSAPSEAVAERRVELQLRRQDILRRHRPAHLWAVVDEAALRRMVGGRAVMSVQLRHLLSTCDMGSVTIQVLPLDSDRNVAGCAFTLLRMPERELPDLVYLEHLATAVYLRQQGYLSYYLHMMNLLTITAKPPKASQDLLRRILGELLGHGTGPGRQDATFPASNDHR